MDTSLYLDINRWARSTPWLHGPLAAYALWGGLAALAVAVVATWWFVLRYRPDGTAALILLIAGGAGSLVALGLNQLIGHAVNRVRPCLAIAHALVLLNCARDPSFPSDHAMIAGALVFALFVADRRVGLVGLALALLLAFARVYAGVHYPSDVAAGLVIGAATDAVVILVARLAFPIVLPAADRLARSPLRPLLTALPPAAAGRPSPPRSGRS